MNTQITNFVLSACLFLSSLSFSQDKENLEKVVPTPLFSSEEILPVRLSYSNKDLKKETNDTTLIDTKFTYKTSTEGENVDIKIRA